MNSIQNINDFFKAPSLDVARDLIGMNIGFEDRIYRISATKAYHGQARQVVNKPRLMYGGLMMFNLRGYMRTCISTGECLEQDYVLLEKLTGEEGHIIEIPSKVSKVLGLNMYYDGKRFSDLFNLTGETISSRFISPDMSKDGKNCIGLYELI